MKNTTVVTDFKDLRKAIEEITKNQPAKSRYSQQAEKMGYTKDKTVVVEQSISEASAFDDMKDIVKTKGAKKIGGVMVDMFTASVITKAYDKVNDANKKKMEKANVQTLVKLAHKVMGLNASHEFDKTPLKGFPFNEVVEDTEIQEWISKNGVRRRVSERDKRKLKEHGLDESKMSDLLIDIQQGATAKELSRDFKIPMSVAKGFLQDYYGQKKGSRKEETELDEFGTPGMSAADKANLRRRLKNKKKGSRKESVNESEFHLFSNKKDADKKAKEIKGKVITGKGKSQGQFMAVKEENLQEGTWAVPDSYKKLYNLQVGFLQTPSKPNPANAKRMAKNIYNIFGDDGFFDDLLRVELGKEGAETDDLRNLIVKHLEPWGLKFKKGATYKITHGPQKWLDNMTANPAESVEERFNQSVQGGKRLVDFEVFLDSKDIEKALKTLSTNLKKDRLSYNKQMKNVKGSPGNFDVIINAIDEEDRWRLIVDGTYYEGELDLTSSFKMIQKLPSAKFKAMYAEDDSVEESAKKRKSGNLKPTGLGRSMKVDLKANWAKEDKLDPVGKGDDDIDNDGDSDDSDDYLRNRRKKISKAMKMKEANQNAKRSPFKLKSQSYPRAVGIETEGYGTRHASREDIVEACDSFGMITEQELQLEQLQKTLGKSGFLTYNMSELNDIFDERETERMILAMESIIPDEKLPPIEYLRVDIDKALDEELEVEFVKPDGMKAVGPVLKMCENTYNLKDKHTGKSFTFKYKDEGGMKTFNEVIAEAKFPKKLVRQAGGIAFDKRYVGGNMTGAVNAIEKLKKGLSDDPKVRDMLRLANESFNNEFYNALSENEKSEYQKFFMSALKKYGVNSPGELEGEKEKDFYNYIDKNWKGKGEKKESVEEGKYTAYSDLLVMKARIIDKEGPKSNKLPAVDDAIRIAMKKLGVKENDTHPSKVKVDGRRTNFREKMKKLGYIKNQY